MRFSGKLALKVGAVGVAAGAIFVPVTAAHAATPAITVTPNTGLSDGDSVTVAGTGYTAGATVAVLECAKTPATASTDCDLTAIATNTATVGADGTFSKAITVHTGTIGTGTCDSTSTTCGITAGNEANQTEAASAGITFKSTTPAGPAVTVTPATGVKDGDTVSVSGTGFPASQPTVYALECGGTGGQADCDISTLNASGSTDASGSFGPISIKVHTGAVGDKTCNAGDTCYIAAATSTTPDATNSATGSFTFAGATTTGAAITISPTTNVKSGSDITVNGTGFAPKTAFYAVECSGTGGQADCDTSALGQGTTDASGNVSGVKVPVHTGKVGDGTCNPGKTCYIAATTDITGQDKSQQAAATFTFGSGSVKPPAKPAKTKTKAAYSSKKQAISGEVTSKGSGVKGVKTKLEFKKGSHWKVVDSTKTKASGSFKFKHVTKSGVYKVKALKNAKFKGSTSKKIEV